MKIKPFDLAAILFSIIIYTLFSWYGWGRTEESGYLLIQDQDGRSLYPLSEQKDILLNGPIGESLIRIENGEAFFVHSDCQDDLCVKSGHISQSREWAACLPNRIFISVSGGEEHKEVDAGVY